MHDPNALVTGIDPALVAAQLAALDRYHAARRQREHALEAAAATRELRLEASRRLEALRREHNGVLARAEIALRDSARALDVTGPRAVVAHRQEWMRNKVAECLAERGASVLAVVADGADASAAVVFEQPDLLFLEDRLPSFAGIEVVERARELAPATVVGVQLLDDRDEPLFVEAGALVLSRRVPPAEVADRLLARHRDDADGGLARV